MSAWMDFYRWGVWPIAFTFYIRILNTKLKEYIFICLKWTKTGTKDLLLYTLLWTTKEKENNIEFHPKRIEFWLSNAIVIWECASNRKSIRIIMAYESIFKYIQSRYHRRYRFKTKKIVKLLEKEKKCQIHKKPAFLSFLMIFNTISNVKTKIVKIEIIAKKGNRNEKCRKEYMYSIQV